MLIEPRDFAKLPWNVACFPSMAVIVSILSGARRRRFEDAVMPIFMNLLRE